MDVTHPSQRGNTRPILLRSASFRPTSPAQELLSCDWQFAVWPASLAGLGDRLRHVVDRGGAGHVLQGNPQDHEDGAVRIYVFNDAAEAERFEKTGELGAGDHAPGRRSERRDRRRPTASGPCELFFFKYGISEPVKQPPPPPPPAPPWKISGLVFGDYYYFGENHLDTATATTPKWKDQQGFWLRRAYFTYDYNLSPKFTTRFRLEANSNGKLQGGNLTPYVKDAYVRWTYYGKQMVYLGHRAVGHLQLARGLLGPAPHREDAGRPLSARLVARLRRELRGADRVDEVQLRRAVRQRLGQRLRDRSRQDASASRSATTPTRASRSRASTATSSGPRQGRGDLPGLRRVRGNAVGRAGLQYLRKNIDSGTSRPTRRSTPPRRSARSTSCQKKATVFGRFDWSTATTRRPRAPACPASTASTTCPSTTASTSTSCVAGLEFYLHPSFRVSPNVEFVSYGDGPVGVSIKDDVVYRMTFYWSF